MVSRGCAARAPRGILVYWGTVLAGYFLRTTDSQPAFSPKECVAMKKETRNNTGAVAVLVLLALLALLVVKRIDLTAEEGEVAAVRTVGKLENAIIRDERVVIAFLVLMALFAFVLWTQLRTEEGEDKAMPPAGESSVSGTTAPVATPDGARPPGGGSGTASA
jgi:hypothetical protein